MISKAKEELRALSEELVQEIRKAKRDPAKKKKLDACREKLETELLRLKGPDRQEPHGQNGKSL